MINKLRWIPIVVLLSLVCVNSSYATIQSHLNFQGFLVKSDGEPVTDGAYDLTVSLWDGPDDGTANKLWDESHSVTVTRGVYSLSLGANKPFPYTMTFTSQYYLGVQVSDGPIMKQDGGLIPLTSTWTAFRAKTSGGRCLRSVSANYTITDDDDIILGSGESTITLPSVSSVANRIFTIRKMDNSNTLYIKTSGSELIDGENRGINGISLTKQYDEVSYISDGQEWKGIGSGNTIDLLSLDKGGLNADVSNFNGVLKVTGGQANYLTITTFVEGFLDDNDADSGRTTLGLKSMATQASDSVDINGGAIDGSTIGATSPAAGTFTTVTATSVDIGGGEIDGTTIGATSPSTGVFTDLTVNNGITLNGKTISSMATQNSNAVNITGGTIDGSTIGATSPAAGTFTTVVAISVDINGGTIDNTTIGGITPTSGVFTTITANNSATVTNLTANTADINGGSIDGTIIGANTTANGSFSTLTATTIDFDAGTIDGTTIGATTQAEAKFTTVTVSDYIYLGTPAINSWRFAIDTNNLQFQQNTVDGWVSRYTITNAGGENP